MRTAILLCLVTIGIAACADSGNAPANSTTTPTYDKATGKLTQLTYDANKNGKIDTWTDMDGSRALRSRIDSDEDGTIDRWEYYDAAGALMKVGFSRKKDGRPDAWAFSGPDGKVQRLEISSAADEAKIDRWEYFDGDVLARAEEDSNGDGRADKWETYENGALKASAMDENGDGKPDRRLTYQSGALTLIESEPDVAGAFQKRVVVR